MHEIGAHEAGESEWGFDDVPGGLIEAAPASTGISCAAVMSLTLAGVTDA